MNVISIDRLLHTKYICVMIMLITSSCSSYRKTPESLQVYANLPLLDDPYFLVTPVIINSKEYNFIIDTCGGNTLLDIKFRPVMGNFIKEMDLPFGFKGDLEKVEICKGPKEFIIGYTSFEGEFACMNMELINLPSDHHYDGIIGMNVLDGFILQFDMENRKMRLLKKLKSENQEGNDCSSDWGYSFNLIRDYRNWPFIHIKLSETIDELFMIDTGMAIEKLNYLRSNFFDKLKDVNGTEYFPDESGQHELILVSEIKMSQIKLSNMSFLSKPQSVLGMSFIKLFKMVTFDLEDNKLYLVPK